MVVTACTRCSLVAVVLFVSGTVAGLAVAQPPSQPALSGPQVKDREVPGVREAFADGGAGKFMRNERMPLPVFVESLKVLKAEDAAPDIRATPEQEEKIRSLVQGFDQEQRKYRESHRGELRRLREATQRDGADAAGGRPGRNKAGAPAADSGDAMTGDARTADPMQGESPAKARQAAAERLREIEQNGPRIEDLYTKVWAELTEPQRVAVEARLDEYRKERAKEREDAYVRQRVGKKDAAAAPPPPPPPGENARQRAPRQGADAQRAERRERLVRAFERLSPEEQDRILDRLEERMRESGRRPGGRADAAPGAKPPPPMDRLRVPAPEKSEQPAGKPD